MSINFLIAALGVLPITLLIAQGLVWLSDKVLELDLDRAEKCFLVGITAAVEAIVTLILLCAAYGKS